MALLFLVAAVVLGIVAWLTGWPTWTSYRAREARDLNAERYLAWRGRAPRGPRASTREGMTLAERRRLWLAGGLGLVALACLVAFFVAS